MNIYDVRASLTSFLSGVAREHTGSDPTILLGMSVTPENRPCFMVETVQGGRVDRLASFIEVAEQNFRIMYLTDKGQGGHIAAERMMAAIQQKLEDNRWNIPGVLSNFKYPRPSVLVKDAPAGVTSNLPIGYYYVSVAGMCQSADPEDLGANNPTIHSDLSDPLAVASGQVIQVTIPEWPRGLGWFEEYMVLIASAADNVLRPIPRNPLVPGSPGTVDAEAILPTVYNITEFPTGTYEVPNPSFLRYRNLRVPQEFFNIGVYRDPSVETGNWIGQINLNIDYPLNARYNDPPPFIDEINIDGDIDYVPEMPIVPTPEDSVDVRWRI